MTITYDLATDIGRMRLLIPDRDLTTAVFDDDEISAFLALEGDVRSAAALALETIAADQALVLKVMRLLDVQTDGRAVAEALLKRAALLRAQAAESTGNASGYFDWAEMVVTDFGLRERLINEGLRG